MIFAIASEAFIVLLSFGVTASPSWSLYIPVFGTYGVPVLKEPSGFVIPLTSIRFSPGPLPYRLPVSTFGAGFAAAAGAGLEPPLICDAFPAYSFPRPVYSAEVAARS